MEEVSKYVLRV